MIRDVIKVAKRWTEIPNYPMNEQYRYSACIMFKLCQIHTKVSIIYETVRVHVSLFCTLPLIKAKFSKSEDYLFDVS